MTWDWDRVRQHLENYSLETIVTLIIITVLTWFAGRIRPHLKKWLLTHKSLRQQIIELQAQLSAKNGIIQQALNAVARTNLNGHSYEGQSLWLKSPIQQPEHYFKFTLGQCIPIWVFANLKGGVAKTTNAINLAAHFATQGEKVLFIDLDYQASATAIALEDHQRSMPGYDSRAAQIIDGQFTPHMLSDPQFSPTVCKQGLKATPNLTVIPSAWDLADAENRLLVQWLLAHRHEDIRFTLARLLHDDITQKKFNRIIIDAPPRLTTACVQALCAATHVIIPTILDQLSGEAVHNFIFQVKRLKDHGICPYLRFGPVLGYRAGDAYAHVKDVEEAIYKTLRDAKLDKDLYRQSEVITHKPLLARSAGTLIGYLRNDMPAATTDVQMMYTKLAKSIQERTPQYAGQAYKSRHISLRG